MENSAIVVGDAGAAPICVRRLSKRYDARQVLNDVSLSIEPGSVLGLIGRNGAGKSTLIRTMLGLIEPDIGTAEIFGERALAMSDRAKERLAYVPQQPDALAWMKVGTMLDYVARFYPTWDADFARNMLDRWQLPRDALLGKLSPGERQRIDLVRALAIRPQLLVLDEPAAALDPAARRELLAEIAVRAADAGTTVLFSTHIVSDLERVASRIVFLHQGRVLLDAPADEIKERFARLIVPKDAVTSDKLAVELHRRKLSDGSAALVIERQPGADWPEIAYVPGARLEILGLEDLFVEVAQ
ncbi:MULTISPECIES: ABC transporter ATP-binding protein [unclassified Rudaea]|uniref:ABC transporter ATP-binding protein n=1 Tax=unclassified Rudaea TaxID=2627037 RepID=UPI002015FDFE|nr:MULTISPECIES: ABC transporter ATP-binding protein [unclassified Rudaea]